MPIYYYYLVLSVYQEVQLPICIFVTITFCLSEGVVTTTHLTVTITFCLSGGAVTITPGPAEGVWSSVWFGILHHRSSTLLHSTPGTGVRDPTS